MKRVLCQAVFYGPFYLLVSDNIFMLYASKVMVEISWEICYRVALGRTGMLCIANPRVKYGNNFGQMPVCKARIR
jgi:hypothetical protein